MSSELHNALNNVIKEASKANIKGGGYEYNGHYISYDIQKIKKKCKTCGQALK